MVESISSQLGRQTKEMILEGKASSPVQRRIEGLVTNGLNYSCHLDDSVKDSQEAVKLSLGLMEFRVNHTYADYLNALANHERDYRRCHETGVKTYRAVRQFYRRFPSLHLREFSTSDP